MLKQRVPPRAPVLALAAREVLHFVMHRLDVTLQIPLLGRLEVAEVAVEVLDLAVHRFDVRGHVIISGGLEITELTGELLLLAAGSRVAVAGGLARLSARSL